MNSVGDWILAITFFFFWLMVLWIFVSCFLDVFRRDDLGGGLKAVWILFMLVLPFLGCLVLGVLPQIAQLTRALDFLRQLRFQLPIERLDLIFEFLEETILHSRMVTEKRMSNAQCSMLNVQC